MDRQFEHLISLTGGESFSVWKDQRNRKQFETLVKYMSSCTIHWLHMHHKPFKWSYRKISHCLEVAWMVIHLLWNLTGVSTAMLQSQISEQWDDTATYSCSFKAVWYLALSCLTPSWIEGLCCMVFQFSFNFQVWSVVFLPQSMPFDVLGMAVQLW